jgi:hypothetical protein
MRPIWVYRLWVARAMASLWDDADSWKTMSPSKSGPRELGSAPAPLTQQRVTIAASALLFISSPHAGSGVVETR